MAPVVDKAANEAKATQPDDMDVIAVDAEQLARWLDVATLLSPSADLVVVALAEFAREPVRFRLRRAGEVCRTATRVASDPMRRKLAELLATEIEVVARS